ncbi:efflux RND transporter periplasmic adaptor subunit [Paracoccus onubensis]|uniref:Efflux RND transporter periplasmic adaptor subunit n=1 Tax=Paracoccus onubensis TaxID=1675788 RepID=A0A418SWQ2_9RHOB|nr:efflux RND transporter periplasmic adaptor subunit [Paracoccus onubensis]
MIEHTRILVAASALGAIFWTSAIMAQGQGEGEMPPPAVTVVTLKSEDVTLTSTLPGRVLASAEAELRPQVNGLVIERLFDEGSVVEQGQPLYRIDPRSYQAAVAQAEAALAQANAQADSARREAERVGALRDRRVASEQTQDSAVAARLAAEAAVKAAEASLQAAQIDLDRTTITAPVDGVIGLALASQGALVTASQAEPLTVIRRIDPVRVDVTQSAAEIIRWQRLGADAALPEGVDRTVSLQLADGSTFENTGSLTAAEPRVDETTGVVTLRMEFANPDGLLLPGMYVQAEIPQAFLRDVVLTPQEGVTRDRRGRPIAMVVNDDNVVETRSLEIAQDRGSDWIVTEGLKDGDRLIVEGLQLIGEGMPVTPEERGAEPAADGEGAPAAGEAAEGGAPTEEAPAQEADPAQEDAAPAEEEPAQEDAAPAEEAAEAQDDTGN